MASIAERVVECMQERGHAKRDGEPNIKATVDAMNKAGIGIGYATLYDIVKGVTEAPAADTLAKIAEFYGVTMDWLATGAEPRERPAAPEPAPDTGTIAGRLRQVKEMERKRLGVLDFGIRPFVRRVNSFLPKERRVSTITANGYEREDGTDKVPGEYLYAVSRAFPNEHGQPLSLRWLIRGEGPMYESAADGEHATVQTAEKIIGRLMRALREIGDEFGLDGAPEGPFSRPSATGGATQDDLAARRKRNRKKKRRGD